MKNETPQKKNDDGNGSNHLQSPHIYELIRQKGVEELDRPRRSLFWSGIAAGIALSFSAYCTAFIHAALSESLLQKALSSVGYTVGFIIVIFGRLQLFTENTITAVLPALSEKSWGLWNKTAQLWGIVFLANMIGSLGSICFVYYGLHASGHSIEALVEVSMHLAHYSPTDCFLLGVPAGFLIASIVWMLPLAKGSEFWMIFLITYMISIGGMTHVVAGSTEWFTLALVGKMSWADALFAGILPTLIGNIAGGTGLFTMLSYGQTKEEMRT